MQTVISADSATTVGGIDIAVETIVMSWLKSYHWLVGKWKNTCALGWQIYHSQIHVAICCMPVRRTAVCICRWTHFAHTVLWKICMDELRKCGHCL